MSGGRLLEVVALGRQFGGMKAVKDLSFHVTEGEIVSIIGPNGAGKTTAFNLITGIYPPSSGAIRFAGRNLVGKQLHEIADAGIGRTFQNLRIFPNLTVHENIMVGLSRRSRTSLLSAMLRLPGFANDERRLAEEAGRLIEVLDLGAVRNQLARTLPYGDQRRVEIARALASDPKLLLLDEPAAGMNPAEVDDLNGLIRRLHDLFKKTVLMIEHHMSLVMDISDRIVVMDHGSKITEGCPGAVREDPLVIRAYLGASTV